MQIRRTLKPDGLFLGALLGGGTLTELREAFAHAESATRGGISPRVAPFADVRDLGGLLQRAGFALPVADVERLTVRYRDFSGLARDLRAHGFTNAMARAQQTPLAPRYAGGAAGALCAPSCRRRQAAGAVRDPLSHRLVAARKPAAAAQARQRQNRGWPRRWAPRSIVLKDGLSLRAPRPSRVESRRQRAAHRGDGGDDHHRDQAGDQRIFDGGGAACRRRQSSSQQIAQHGNKRQVGRGHGIIAPCPWAGPISSAA